MIEEVLDLFSWLLEVVEVVEVMFCILCILKTHLNIIVELCIKS
jgi:hypothetical protein